MHHIWAQNNPYIFNRNDERMNSRLFFKYFYAGIVQSNLCWKIHNKYVFHVNIHIFVLKYLVQIQMFKKIRSIDI
jgi:hypothetical protein